MAVFSSSRSLLAKVLIVILVVPSQVSSICYYPGGRASDDLACDPSAPVSSCCKRGWTCLSNGVCERREDGILNWARESCTDHSWNSPVCPQFCIPVNVNGEAKMYNCTETEWCCDQGLVDRGCCSDPDSLLNLGVRRIQTSLGDRVAPPTSRFGTSSASLSVETNLVLSPAIQSIQANQSDVSQSLSSNTSAAASRQSRPTGTNSASLPSSNDNIAAKVGAGVGAFLGASLIAAMIYIVHLRRKKHTEGHEEVQQTKQSTPEKEISGFYAPQMLDDTSAGYRIGHELDGRGRKPRELDGQGIKPPVVQLPATRDER